MMINIRNYKPTAASKLVFKSTLEILRKYIESDESVCTMYLNN